MCCFIYNYPHFYIALLWIMKLELHSRINDKNAHNVVKCKEISMQMSFKTAETNLSFLDVRFSSSVVCWLAFETGNQER
jgi:hypothetical protein